MFENKFFIRILIVVIILSMVILPLLSATISADKGSMLIFNFIEKEEVEENRVFYTKDLTISGIAKENTEITVNIYWNKPLHEKGGAPKNTEIQGDYTSDEWIEQDSLNRTVGAAGTFAIPAKINIGKYKIEAIAKHGEDEIAYEVYVVYKDRNRIVEKLRRKLFRNLDFDI